MLYLGYVYEFVEKENVDPHDVLPTKWARRG